MKQNYIMGKIIKWIIWIVAICSVWIICAYNVHQWKEDTKSNPSNEAIESVSNDEIVSQWEQVEQEKTVMNNRVEAEIMYDAKNWIISITDWKTTISMADKNVWATDVCYWKDGNVNCYGLYYQRWWSTGYAYSLTAEESISKWFDIDSTSWASATSDVVWSESDICPEWYHIPTKDEWQRVINMYLWDKINEKTREAKLHSLGTFYKLFKIPFAGYRMYDRAQLWRAGEWNSVYLRSASRDGNKQAYYVDVDSYWLASVGSKVRNYGYPIRCFLDN